MEVGQRLHQLLLIASLQALWHESPHRKKWRGPNQRKMNFLRCLLRVCFLVISTRFLPINVFLYFWAVKAEEDTAYYSKYAYHRAAVNTKITHFLVSLWRSYVQFIWTQKQSKKNENVSCGGFYAQQLLKAMVRIYKLITFSERALK